jgi:ankyrin repeat protein
MSQSSESGTYSSSDNEEDDYSLSENKVDENMNQSLESVSSVSEDDEEDTPHDVLYELIRLERVSEIRQLVETEAVNIDTPDDNGETAIYHAIECSSKAALRELVALGADLNVVHEEYDMEPAIFTAVELNRAEILKELIALGADPECVGFYENPILVEIIRLNRMDCLEALVEVIEERQANKMPTFKLFVEEALFKCIEQNNLKALRRLLEAFALEVDLDRPDENDEFLITQAIDNNLPEILRELIVNGADVNRQENLDGHTPIMMAAMSNRLECAKILQEYGSQNSFRWNATFSACQNLSLPHSLSKVVCEFAGFVRIDKSQIGKTDFGSRLGVSTTLQDILKKVYRT